MSTQPDVSFGALEMQVGRALLLVRELVITDKCSQQDRQQAVNILHDAHSILANASQQQDLAKEKNCESIH